jgi:hypothetical protein
MRSFFLWAIGVGACLAGAGCGTTRVMVLDASTEGGSILIRGPEPNLAAHDYLATACPRGYRIVSADDAATTRAVDLANIGLSTGRATELTYICERAQVRSVDLAL